MSHPLSLTAMHHESRPAARAGASTSRKPRRASSRARARMQADLLHAKLGPDTALRPLPLSKRYGVSAGTMREVLVELTAMRLVVRDPADGFRVAPADQAHFLELVTTAKWLDEIALRESIANSDAQWEETVLGTHAALVQSPLPTRPAAIDRLAEWEERLLDFHDALASGCRSSILRSYCAELQQHLLRYRNLAGALEHHACERTGLLAVRNAALARDADLAIESLRSTAEALTHAILKSGIPY